MFPNLHFWWLVVVMLPYAFAQLQVAFSPSSAIHSIVFDTHTYEWQITASYARDAQNNPTTNVPIMYMPAPGNGLLEASQHPCIVSPTPCCLLDFAEQYTVVGLFEILSRKDGLSRENCAEITDFRPTVQNLAGNETVLVVDALKGIFDTNVSYVGPVASTDSSRTVSVRIHHSVMKNHLATRHTTVRDGISTTNLRSYLGFLWLRTTPVVGTNYGFQVSVAQPSFTLNVIPYLEMLPVYSETQNCTMTPQGICLVCNNELPPYAYFIYTDEGALTGQCEFRCQQGAYFSQGPPSRCVPCDEGRTCSVGQYPADCDSPQAGQCVPCSGEGFCPQKGYYVQLCANGSKINPGCTACTNAPDAAVYTNGCEWECAQGYALIGQTCVFLIDETARFALNMQLFLSNIYPEGDRQEGEVALIPEAFRESLATFVPGVSKDDVYIARILRVNATVVQLAQPPSKDQLLGNTRRRILQDEPSSRERLDPSKYLVAIELGGNDNFTQIDCYMWLPPSSGEDAVQEVVNAVIENKLQKEIQQRHNDTYPGVAFAQPPSYATPEQMIAILQDIGVAPQGNIPQPPPDPNADNTLCAFLAGPGLTLSIMSTFLYIFIALIPVTK